MKDFWKKIRGWLLFLLILAGLYAVLHFYVFVPDPVSVRVHRVDKGIVEELVANTRAGSVRADMRSRISTDTPGTITKINPTEGEKVKKGEPLIQLDDRTQKRAVEIARRELALAKAQQERAEAERAEAKREYNRTRELLEKKAVSQSDLDRAETTLSVARAELSAASARVDQFKAQLERARLELEKRTITAPFTGTISEIYVELGEWATPGNPLLELMTLENLYIEAELDEVDIGDIKKGMNCRISLDPFPNKKFTGKITRISSYISEELEQNRTVTVEVAFSKETKVANIKPGTSADVEVIVDRTNGKVLRVPTLAVLEGDRVLVVRDGIAREVNIKTGMQNWDYTQVLEGLEEGDPVITSLEKEEVKANTPVLIQEQTNP